MKKNKLLLLSSVALLLNLTGCGKGENSSMSENSPESVASEEVSEESSAYQEQGSYVLEENEVYHPVSLSTDTLKEMTTDTVSVDGFDKVYKDPFSSYYFAQEATIRYPSEDMLSGKTVLYTSDWYRQTTAKRNDEVTEYVLIQEEGMWFVSEISNQSETFIPFNGAVLSVPKTSNITFEVDDQVGINTSLPTYQIGFYNQDGIRVAISYANDENWGKEGINLYDEHCLSLMTNTTYAKVSMMNFVYNESTNTYTVDKFRVCYDDKRLNINVNKNGFTLAATLTSGNDNIAVLEGARFNLGDTIKVEENATLHENYHVINIDGTANSYTTASGTIIKYTVKKSTSASDYSDWGSEVAVDKNGIITDYDAHVTIPTGGYKLQISSSGSSTSEQLSYLFENVFGIGGKVLSSGSKAISVNLATQVRATNAYSQIASQYEDAMDDLASYNYSYNVSALNTIGENLDAIKEEMDQFKSDNDPTSQYHYYTLIGALNQQYFQLISATSRDEAVMNKSSWYIVNLSNYDASLETIQDHLQIIKSAGYNEIIVDAYESGYSYYSNSKYFTPVKSMTSKDYGEYGNDLIKALTGEAHKLGIKIFIDFTPFTDKIEVAFTELSDCKALSIEGKTSVVSSQGKVEMLDPSNEKVQDAIQKSVEDILESNPDIDGIHLDYIRYGADNNYKSTLLGVTESARVAFNEYCSSKGYSYSYSSLDELRSALNSDGNVLYKFNEYEQTAVTNTVINIKEVCKKYDKPLTAAVADNYSLVKTWKCQDWADWAVNGYVDALYLMDYYFGEYTVSYYFQDMIKNTKNACMLICGIDPTYANLAKISYAKTIKGAVKNIESAGYATFGTHTNDRERDSWTIYTYSNWIDSLSIYDSLDKTMKAEGDMLLSRCDEIYITYNNQTAAQKAELSKDLDDLYALIQGDDLTSANAVMNKITEMKQKTYASNAAVDRINEQLDYMYNIARMKANIYSD